MRPKGESAPAAVIGPFRKVLVALWGDEKFRALSRLAPSGQALYLFASTGPFTSSLPGLLNAGRAAMAEALDWQPEQFTAAFDELEQLGMARADFTARLVWLPDALRVNLPQSPNVVRSWASAIRMLPACTLKAEALAAMRSVLVEETGEASAFVEAWDKACGNPSAKPFVKASPKPIGNQEQEKEQESPSPSLRSGEPRARRAAPLPEDFGVSAGVREWARRDQFEPFLEQHLEYFRDYCAARGARYVDHDAAFKNCIRADWGDVRRNASRKQGVAGPVSIGTWRAGGEPDDVIHRALQALGLQEWQAPETHGQARARVVMAGGEELLHPPAKRKEAA